jgi:hypothetical protein
MVLFSLPIVSFLRCFILLSFLYFKLYSLSVSLVSSLLLLLFVPRCLSSFLTCQDFIFYLTFSTSTLSNYASFSHAQECVMLLICSSRICILYGLYFTFFSLILLYHQHFIWILHLLHPSSSLCTYINVVHWNDIKFQQNNL